MRLVADSDVKAIGFKDKIGFPRLMVFQGCEEPGNALANVGIVDRFFLPLGIKMLDRCVASPNHLVEFLLKSADAMIVFFTDRLEISNQASSRLTSLAGFTKRRTKQIQRLVDLIFPL